MQEFRAFIHKFPHISCPLLKLVDKPQNRPVFRTEIALAKMDKNSKKDQHKVGLFFGCP